ncbi:hypothetical protein RMATCC62417_05229 [Rhizopus microsporus]|nr:hypothetical protein RMATCC62417_05229 [Rhizopus microsporus]
MSMELDSVQDSQDLSELRKLEFAHSILGKRSALKEQELLPHLKELHQKLKELEQGAVDLESLSTVANDLTSTQILKNSSKMVTAVAACCLADILRLYAPEAPYSNLQLKKIFSFFVSNLSQFGKEDENLFQYHFYLLESLATVKSFIIISDLDNADEITLPVFDEFFKAGSNPSLPKNVQVCMTDIMTQIIDEVGTSAQEIIEIILDQFVKHEKTPTAPSYLMAAEVCSICAPILQRRVCQYFSDILLSVSNAEGTEELEELRKAHDLIIKVNAVVPDLLLNVLPLVQEEMKLDQANVRQIATETMGKLFMHPESNISEKYPTIWKTWLGRKDDKLVQLRVKWLEMCVDIYKNHTESMSEITECIKLKLSDPDEKVRATACKIIGEIMAGCDLKHIDRSMLELVDGRTKDKKNSVRVQAMKTMGSIYNEYYASIQANEKMAVQKLGWIPNSLFSRVYTGDASVLMTLQDTLLAYIFPYDEDDQQRTERLVTVVESLEEKQKLAFTAIIRKQQRFNDDLQKYVRMCEDEVSGMTTDHEETSNDKFMKYLAAHFADRPRTFNALRAFLIRKNSRDIKLLKNSIRADHDYKQLYKSKDKLIANLNEDQAGTVEIFQAIINRACPLIVNKACITHLLKMAKEPKGRRQTALSQKALTAQSILKEISITYPVMYEGCLTEITKGIMNDKDNIAEELELLAELSKSNPGHRKYDSNLIKRLRSYVVDGKVGQANLASVILGNMKNADRSMADLVESLSDELSLKARNLLSTLTSLSQFALYTPRLLTPYIDLIVKFVEENLLKTPTKSYTESNPEWVAYDKLPELSKQKITGVRLLVNYLTACRNEMEPEEHIITKTFSILWDLLERTCDGALTDNTNSAETSHLRLGASQAIVKLTHYDKYLNELTVPKFERLSYTLQDTCFYVRLEFAEFLMKGLQTEQIHPRYYSLLFICAHEPEESLLKQIRSFIQKRLSSLEIKQAESTVLDSSLVRLVHLLAHHPDFTITTEDLMVFAQYIRFFLSCVATAENVSFLYHIAQKIKLSKDMVSAELSDNSYVLSDMTSLLIKYKCKESSWPLNAYAGRVTLQSKLYKSLPPGAVQNETMEKSYLPQAFIEKLEEEERRKLGDKVTWKHNCLKI